MSDVPAFRVIAHRGWSDAAPENTFAAFDKALSIGVNSIETDLRRTRDGEIVLMHDADVDRTTSGHGPLAQLSLAEVQALDAGSWFSEEFAGERVPTLRGLFERYGTRIDCDLEIKDRGLEAKALRLIAGYDLADHVLISSSKKECLHNVKALSRTQRCGWLVRALDEATVAEARDAGFETISPPAGKLAPEQVAAAHAMGLSVRAWGVRDEVLMRHVVECGADGTTINFPDKLVTYLDQRGSGTPRSQ